MSNREKLINALMNRALGYDYEEVKTIIEITPTGEKKQRVEKYKKHCPPDISAIKELLKKNPNTKHMFVK